MRLWTFCCLCMYIDEILSDKYRLRIILLRLIIVDEDEMTLIRQAVSHWEEHTCLRFFEVNKDAVIKQNHLLFTRALKA